MTRPRRVGIVGTGFAAAAHLDALSRIPGAEAVGVLGSALSRTRAAAERFSVGRAFGSLEELLDGVDVVHNCTPNDVHAEVTLAALEAGVHVLSEKPLGIDAAAAARLAAAAASTNVVTGVCFVYRHFPLVQQMRALLDEGTNGPIHLVHGAYLQDWLLRPDDWNWRLESTRAGASRAMGDIGSHWIDLVQHVTGDLVTWVCAEVGRAHDMRLRPPEGEPETFASGGGDGQLTAVDTEDMALVLFRTASGVRGSVTVSQVSAGWKNHLVLEVDAAEASFVWDQEEPNRLRIGRRDRANRDVLRDPSLLAPAAARLAHFPGGHQEGWPDALRNLFEDFYAAVDAGTTGAQYAPTFASFSDAARVQAVVEAVLRSDATGVWVDVDDIVKEVSM
ncbi:MAG: Gfo/Idh/MocA family oxidoreductase [Actinobacteria bacterium]|nr:MAG: Gfo/Idh/MocA family oxidoreductase [Actinomycetota bacterium]